MITTRISHFPESRNLESQPQVRVRRPTRAYFILFYFIFPHSNGKTEMVGSVHGDYDEHGWTRRSVQCAMDREAGVGSYE